jgi:uncharacterized protein (DUF488 family)
LLELLRAHGVEQLIDVRTIPRSRHNPQFNGDRLSHSLDRAGIRYVHLKTLGGLRHARTDSVNLGWRNASFRGFADYMQTENFADGLRRLEVLADALTVAKWRVLHIQSRKTAVPHQCTPFLVVRSARLLYPGRKSSF